MFHAKDIVHMKFEDSRYLGFYFGTDSDLIASDWLGDELCTGPEDDHPPKALRKIKQALKSLFQKQCHEQGLFNTDLVWRVYSLAIRGQPKICYIAYVSVDHVVSCNSLHAESRWHQVDLSEEDTSGESKETLMIKHIVRCATEAKIVNARYDIEDSNDVMSLPGQESKIAFELSIQASSLTGHLHASQSVIDEIMKKISDARNQRALNGASSSSQSGQTVLSHTDQSTSGSQPGRVVQECTDDISCSSRSQVTAAPGLPQHTSSSDLNPTVASSASDSLPPNSPKMFLAEREMSQRDEAYTNQLGHKRPRS